jgi:deoxycytidylate deaminase
MSEVAVAYIPVLHEGYRRFVEAHASGRPLYLIGPDLYRDYRPLAKDIRCLDAQLVVASIGAWDVCSEVAVLDESGAELLAAAAPTLTLPAEDVSYQVVERWFSRCAVRYDTVFLRWDKVRSAQLFVPSAARQVRLGMPLAEPVAAAGSSGEPREKPLEETIAQDDVLRVDPVAATTAQDDVLRVDPVAATTAQDDVLLAELAAVAQAQAAGSADWWRQVGAAIRFADGTICSAVNEHSPHRLSAYAVGDPRANFSQGVHLELSTATHAEARLIAEAARDGVSTKSAVMYVTDFPCPPCAKLIAAARIAKLYFRTGYAVLDGEDVLAAAGVEIVQVS